MSRQIELRLNVTDAARIGEPVHVCATVILPDPAISSAPPIVAFAKPGGGYSRGYYTHALPGIPTPVAQADWHAARGWIFVALDHLGADGTVYAPQKLGYDMVTRALHEAERQILELLAHGTVSTDFPAVRDPVTIGIGHSVGGAVTVAQQGRFHGYDGIAILGFSAVHSHPAVPPGELPVVVPWTPRDSIAETPFPVINEAAVSAGLAAGGGGGLWRALAWGFYYDDVPHEIVARDLAHLDAGLPGARATDFAPWSSGTQPGAVAQTCLTPGVVAPEAAAVTVPVLAAMGERDMVVDPPGEPRAYKSARSIDLFICPHMGHIHNLAGTRELLWERIDRFGAWCAVVTAAGRSVG